VIVLLLPINGLIFLATFAPGLLKFSGLLGFVLLAILGQFAVYRARRYRLTRTVYRGVRLYQTGSAWAYALRSILWFVAMAVTLGLAYPWAVANLERYKLRHTHYGDLTGAFAGSGTRLFFRGALMWAIVIVPLTAGIVAALAAVDWETLAAALSATGQHDRLTFEEIMPSIAAGIVFLAAGGGWSILAAALLYPLFRAVTMRWWLAGLRLGPIVATSHLRNGQVYSLYLRFIGFSILFAIGAGILGGMVLGFVNAAAKTFDLSASLEIGQWGLALVAYVAAMLSYSAIYQATVMVRYWRLSFETTELDGLRAIDTVKAAGTPASAFGEGLADALNVGGL